MPRTTRCRAVSAAHRVLLLFVWWAGAVLFKTAAAQSGVPLSQASFNSASQLRDRGGDTFFQTNVTTGTTQRLLPLRARYVRVAKTDGSGAIDMSELQVFAPGASRTSIAIGKTATSSSQWCCNYGPASNVIDGVLFVKDGVYSSADVAAGALRVGFIFAHTAASGDPNPWIEVDLGAETDVALVVMHGRYSDRLMGTTLSLLAANRSVVAITVVDAGWNHLRAFFTGTPAAWGSAILPAGAVFSLSLASGTVAPSTLGLRSSNWSSVSAALDRFRSLNAVQLQGAHLEVDVPVGAVLPLGSAPRSVSAWVSTSAGADVVSWGGSAAGTAASFAGVPSSRGAHFGVHVGSFCRHIPQLTALVSAATGGDGALDCVSPRWFSAADGLWHNIVATYDGRVARVYLDGSRVPSAPFQASHPLI